MKFLFVFSLLGGCCLAGAQTNLLAIAQPGPELVITSRTFIFDGKASQIVYVGNVFATDNINKSLHCGELTADLPRNGGDPTNIVAETNVIINYLDNKGLTNRISAAKAVYDYHTATNDTVIVTNKIVTFSGGAGTNLTPIAEGPQYIFKGDPLIYDFIAQQFGPGPNSSNFVSIFKLKPGSGTNASPFNFLK